MTPALQLLQREKVPHTERPYQLSLDADAFGLEAAEKLGVEPERVFKTLVCQGEGVGLFLVLMPSALRIDFKKLARVLGTKKQPDMADAGVAERATGYVVGGISPLGGRKKLPVIAEETIELFDTVLVNAGRRGLLVELASVDLLRLTEATTADIGSERG